MSPSDEPDIDSWGQHGSGEDENTPNKKREKTGQKKEDKPATKPPRWELKPNRTVTIDDVPIDAFRGLYYLIVERKEKKLTKVELKRALQELLSSKEKMDKLVQNIANVVMS
nr:hypothetical protein [Candidatus Sigynarchaeota archaeon]